MTLIDQAAPTTTSWSSRPVRHRVTVVEGVALAVAAVFALALLYALLQLALVLVEDGSPLEPFAEALTMPGTGKVFVDTAVVVVLSTVVAVVFAVGFAWLNERTNARLGFVAAFLPLVPLLVPTLASTIGWVFLAADRAGVLNVLLRDALAPLGFTGVAGPLNIYSLPGMVFLYAINVVPFVYLPVSAAMSRLDPSLEEASRVAGVGPLRTLSKVTVPAIRPAIAGGVLLAVALGLANFAVGVVVGTGAKIDVLAVRVYNLLTSGFPPHTAEAVALSTILLATVLTLSIVQQRLTRRGGFATIGGKGVGAASVDLGWGKWVARAVMILFIACASVIPLLGLVYIALRGYWEPALSFSGLSFDSFAAVFTGNPVTTAALGNSVLLGVVGGLLTLAVATLIVLVVALRGGIAGSVLDALAKAPIALSHLVLAIAILLAFSGRPFWIGGTLLILLLAFGVFYMPQAYVAASSAHAQIGAELTEASAVSGASPTRTLLRVTLPLMLPGLAGGAIVLFVLIMSEVTGSALLSDHHTPVVGFVMLDLWLNGTFSTIAALGVVMTVITTGVAMVLLWVGRRGASVNQ